MVCQQKTHKYFCFARLLIFLCLPFQVFAQFSGTWQLKPPIIEEGEKFSLIFHFAGDIGSSLHIKEPMLPQDLKKIDGPFISFEKKDNQTRVEFIYISDKVGFVKLNPFIFTLDRRHEWSSPLVHVGIGEDSIVKENDTFPLRLELKVPKKEFVLGESVGIGLFTLGNQRISDEEFETLHFDFPSSWQSYPMPLYFDVCSLHTPQGQILRRPLLNWLVSCREEGTFTLPAFTLEREGKKYSSEELKVLVQKPQTDLDLQAVGVFNLVMNLSEQELGYGDTLKVTMVLTGEGNFNELNFPSLCVEKSSIISFKEENSLQVGEKGLKGSLFRTYVVAPDSCEDLKITVPAWSYWDVKHNKPITLSGSQYVVSVKGRSNKQFISLAEQENLLVLLNKEQMHARKFAFLFANPLSYLLLLPGVLIFIFLFFKSFLSRVIASVLLLALVFTCCNLYYLQEKRVTDIQDCFDNLDERVFYQEPQNFLNELDQILSEPCPAYYKANCFYNKAIILNYLKRKEEAIYSLYIALKQVPLHAMAQDALRVISLTLGNEEFINFHGLTWVNWLFGGILLSLNLFFLTFLIFQRDRVKRFFSLLIISVLLLFQVFFIFNWLKQIYKPIGVLKGSFIPICKVPDFYTRAWLFGRGGLAVYIMEETKHFYRIKLPSGIQGWVKKSYMSELP